MKTPAWSPKEGKIVWFLDCLISADSFIFDGNECGERMLAVGNLFPSRKACREAAIAVKKTLGRIRP